MAFEDKTNEQLIQLSVALKKEQKAIRDRRLAIANELRARDLKHSLETKLKAMSEPEKEALKGMLGNVVVTPAPATLKADGK